LHKVSRLSNPPIGGFSFMRTAPPACPGAAPVLPQAIFSE